jgi:hypothetical protein
MDAVVSVGSFAVVEAEDVTLIARDMAIFAGTDSFRSLDCPKWHVRAPEWASPGCPVRDSISKR